MSVTCYLCEGDHCLSPSNSYCHNASVCWTSVTREREQKTLNIRRGCSGKEMINLCHPHLQRATVKNSYNISCCSTNLCNNGSVPHLEISADVGESPFMGRTFAMILVSFLFCIIFLGAFSKVRKRRKKKQIAEDLLAFRKDICPEEEAIRPEECDLVKDNLDGFSSSGSGSGVPLCMQRSMARNITLFDLKGKGKYGEVWRGVWNADNIAVKIFFSKDEASWARETQIYSTVAINHPNILAYLASDMTSRNSTTQLWLITQYHERGSLYDYLNAETLDYKKMFRLVISFLRGINHLHTEIFGANFIQGKPAIAHRDIKSKNVLVNHDEECVIGDFGLAVMYYQNTNSMNIADNPKIGTKRYMAPEMLDETMHLKDFEAFKKVDMYAVSLVLWEIFRRTGDEEVEEYKPPFFDVVDNDPSFEQMKAVVCDRGIRPNLTPRWQKDPVLSVFIPTINECWSANPWARPSALRMLKRAEKYRDASNF